MGPGTVFWRNYVAVLTLPPFEIFLLNTVIITALSVVGELVSSAVVAYSFARLRWAARNTLFIVVPVIMMLPWQVTLIPTFILFTRVFDWKDTLPSPDRAVLLRRALLRVPAAPVLHDAALRAGYGSDTF